MNAERFAHVKEIFLAACELPAERRIDALDQACGDDPELRCEVESLLRHHDAETTLASRLPTPWNSADTTPPAEPERFPPGTVIAGRYRVLAKLGQGGMGEVYRAEDLQLEQSVALKFLTRELTADARALKRFRDEVRLARKVTHPNVVRVHDLGEAAGEMFLSMEYVDGENLEALLRRIGRLPHEKAIETTRQICAGLGAANDKGVLHRDLKLQNVMIDAEGRVRITDFGIAALAATVDGNIPLAGTLAYMAPELWKGEPPSIRSDLYSLGVVLYEMTTGKPPFPDSSPRPNVNPGSPVSPGVLVPDVDPALERAILKCLETDPALRPRSAYEVLAALPGSIPWAAILAAGGTPSPEMIAAAELPAAQSSRYVVGLMAAALVGLIGVVLLADQTLFLSQAAPQKPPAVLADRAQQIIHALGYESNQPAAWGFNVDPEFMEATVYSHPQAATTSSSSQRLGPAIGFWYRRGEIRLPEPIPLGEPSLVRPPEIAADTILVRLDTHGSLREFVKGPGVREPQDRAKEPADWSRLFQLAELQLANFHEQPPGVPPVFADRVWEWESAATNDSEAPIRVDAATYQDRVVFFQVRFPWEQYDADDLEVFPASRAISRTFAVRFYLNLALLAVASVLAWRNACTGHGDRRGAGRLALFIAALAIVEWLVGKRHVPLLGEEATSMFLWLGRAALVGSAIWVGYLAVEPYVRRFWPESIVSWSRLLTGNWHDRLVRRDILVGTVFGVTMVLLVEVDALLPDLIGQPQTISVLPYDGSHLDDLLGVRYKLGAVMNCLVRSISAAFLLLLVMLGFRGTIRQPHASALAYGVFLAVLLWFLTDSGYLTWLTAAIFAAGIVAVLTRVGLTALIAGLFVRSLLLCGPITRHWDAWYAPAGNCVLVLVALLAVWCAHDAFSRGGTFDFPARKVS